MIEFGARLHGVSTARISSINSMNSVIVSFRSLSLSLSEIFFSSHLFVMSPTVGVYGHRVVSLAGVVARCSTQRISVKNASCVFPESDSI